VTASVIDFLGYPAHKIRAESTFECRPALTARARNAPLADQTIPTQILTFKYRLKDRSATKHLRAYATACNQVWNYCNAYQRDIEDRYRAGAPKRKWPSHFDLTKLTKGTSKELGICAQTVQVICKQFAKNRDEAHHSLRFRSSFGARRSLGWVPFQSQSRRVDGNSIIYLGKRIRWFGNKRRPLPETAKGGAFVEDSLGRWWVAFHVEVLQNRAKGNGDIGIDLGLKNFATMSDGAKIEAPRIYRKYESKLAVVQRSGNKRRAKAINAKIKNCRHDFLHKLSTALAGQNALIAVGDVNSKELAKTRMAKSVLDAGWSSFRGMLKYKSAGYVEVDEKFTTQTCSGCGSIAGPKGYAGLNKREWNCPDCGESHDRDVNSAKVILLRALSAQRHVDESRRLT
jgi:putative transposase